MSEFVIDASAALSWVLGSQSTAASVAFIEARDGESFVAPHIFSWEVGNILVGLYRRRRLSSNAYAKALSSLDALEIALQPALAEAAIRDFGALATGLGLSLFDTAYLGLAIERDCGLVSRDDRLLAVARARDVACVDLRGNG